MLALPARINAMSASARRWAVDKCSAEGMCGLTNPNGCSTIGFVNLTLAELRKRVGDDEEAAYGLLEELRWPTGPVCPHCGHDKAYFLTPKDKAGRRTGPGAKRSVRRVWKCAKCRRQFSVLTNTIFHG